MQPPSTFFCVKLHAIYYCILRHLLESGTSVAPGSGSHEIKIWWLIPGDVDRPLGIGSVACVPVSVGEMW
jgi:hypothetical protein